MITNMSITSMNDELIAYVNSDANELILTHMDDVF